MGKLFIRRQRASCNVLAHKIWSAYPKTPSVQ